MDRPPRPFANETILAGIRDGIIVLDMQDRVVDLNPAAQDIIGRPSAEVVGRPVGQVLITQPDLLEPYRGVFEAQAEVDLGEGESQRTYDLNISPLTDSKGQRVGRVLVLRDITRRKQAEAELRAQKQLFENLVAVARATGERPALEDTLQSTLDVTVTLTGADTGSIFLLDGAGAVINSILSRGEVKAEQRQDILGLVMEKGLAGWVFRQRQAMLITDTSQSEHWLALPGHPTVVRSALAVPIIKGGVVLGILTLVHSQVGHFNAEHVELLQAAADQMALAVRNAQIFDELQQVAGRRITLYEILRSLSGQLDPDTLLRTAVDAIVKYVHWPNVAIIVPGEDGKQLLVHTARGDLSPAAGLSLPFDQGMVGRTFTTAMIQYAPDVEADPDCRPDHPAIRSQLVVPIRRGDQTLGVLNLLDGRLDAFDADDVMLAESLVEAIALALDNARLFRSTQQERSRLQALIQSSRDGVIFVSLDQRIRVVNEPALRFLRLPGGPEDWLGRSLGEALNVLQRTAPPVVQALLAEVQRTQEGDESSGEGEFEVSPRAMRWQNLPVAIGKMPMGRLLVLRDVTEERALERLREDMTHTMVHDLRNPLTNIVTSLSLLLKGYVGEVQPRQREVLGVAEQGAQRMRGLVDAILDVSRLERGQMPINYESFSLSALVAETLHMQEASAKEKDLRLESDVPASLPPAWADAGLVGRVLQNLVDNAIKFTPEGGGVRVAARAEERDGRTVLLVEVSDTGSGIPAEIQSRLFQKFVTGRQRGRGSGLGLAFCRLVVEAHEECIWVESRPEGGTTFAFILATGPA